jgi:hypothetical protein
MSNHHLSTTTQMWFDSYPRVRKGGGLAPLSVPPYSKDYMKITTEMVKYWVGDKYNDAIKIILEIANSHRDNRPWTPDILNNDIKQSWNEHQFRENKNG